MRLPSDIRDVSFNTYHGFGRALDYIWDACGSKRGDPNNVAKYMPLLAHWRATINKMRINSSTTVSLAEKLNYNRACRDIDSLLYRLSKISGKVPIKVIDDVEPESAEPSDDP